MNARTFFFTVLLAVSCVCIESGKLSVSNAFISRVSKKATELLPPKIIGFKLNEISQVIDVPVAGKFAITIKDLVVQSIAIPAPKVQLVEPNIIRLKVSNFSASISCVVHYERQSGLVPLSDTVSAMITIGNSTLSASSSLGEKNGIPIFTVDSCEPSIGKIDIKLNGGASWLYSTIISMFSGKISETIEDILRNQVPEMINEEVNKIFASTNFKIKVTDKILFDATLSGSPKVTKPFSTPIISIPDTAAFIDAKTQQLPPIPTSVLPDAKFDSDLQFIFGDYIFNSLMYTLVKTDSLNMTFSYFDVPEKQQRFMNTTFYRFIVEPLYHKYPGMPISINVDIADEPTLNLTKSEGISFNATAMVSFSVFSENNPNAKLYPAFTLRMGISGSAFIDTTEDDKIVGSVTAKDVIVQLVNSQIGDFDVEDLQKIVKAGVDFAVLTANTFLKHGVEIPTFGPFSVHNAKIELDESYCQLTFNISFSKQRKHSRSLFQTIKRVKNQITEALFH